MLIGHEDRQLVSRATVALAQKVVRQREEHPEIHKTISSIEKAVIRYAMRRGESEADASERVQRATKAKLGAEDGAEDGFEILGPVVNRTRDRLAKLKADAQPSEGPIYGNREHPLPQLGIWTFTHSLLRVTCVKETPAGPFGLGGKDEMLYSGTFTYAGPGGLNPYYRAFSTGESHTPTMALAAVPVVPGRHRYRATHLVAEQDFADEENSKIIAVGFTLLLDLLIEAGIILGKAALLAFLKAQCPEANENSPPEKKAARELCLRIAEETVEAIGKVAREESDDLLGLLAEWLAEALGPEVFPTMTSEATIEWFPPAWPVVTDIRVVGSGTVKGIPSAFAAPGTSVVLGVPLNRSGGGSYKQDFAFTISGMATIGRG